MKIDSINNINSNKQKKIYSNISPFFTGTLSLPVEAMNKGSHGMNNFSLQQKLIGICKKITRFFNERKILDKTLINFGELISKDLLLINENVAKKAVINSELNILIGPNAEIQGKIFAKGNVNIQGKVMRGSELVSCGNIIVEKSAFVDGMTSSDGLTQVYGEIAKNASVNGNVILYEGARVHLRAGIDSLIDD